MSVCFVYFCVYVVYCCLICVYLYARACCVGVVSALCTCAYVWLVLRFMCMFICLVCFLNVSVCWFAFSNML